MIRTEKLHICVVKEGTLVKFNKRKLFVLLVAFFASGGHTVKLLRIFKNKRGATLGADFCDLLVYHLLSL